MNIKNLKHLTMGFVLGSLFFSGISFAASTIKLEANYGIKLIHNNIDKTPIDSNSKPFVVNGTTYVPLRVVSNLLDTDVKYDSSKKAVIIGTKVDGTPLPLPSDFTSDDDSDYYSKDTSMMINNKTYGQKGYKIHISNYYTLNDSQKTIKANFSLNGKYKKLHLGIGLDDAKKTSTTKTIVFKDQSGVELYRISAGQNSVQENIEIDTYGVNTLTIEITTLGVGATIDLINPVLIK